ncbi:hypothetical protein ACWD26_21290 [Streptomyces sp. NPDC002787]
MRGQTGTRGLRFASMAVIVVLALTGFSTGRGSSGGGGSSDGGSGGGCSSSSQDHDTSSSSSSGGTSGLGKSDDDYDDYGDGYDDPYDDGYDDSYDDTTGQPQETEETLEDAQAELIRCATAKAPYATVKVWNRNTTEGAFNVTVMFEDAKGRMSLGKVERVTVPAQDTVTVRIEVGDDDRAKLVDHCSVEESAPQAD